MKALARAHATLCAALGDQPTINRRSTDDHVGDLLG
jgi:hypothetical protein